MKVNSITALHQRLLALAIVALFGSTAGCSERLMRENVFANTETGFGLFVAQNAKTQMYEAKLGYFRHELFFVPTSKTIKYVLVDGKRLEGEVVSNDPSLTPEVLADIAIGAKADGTHAGFEVRQRLAVGKIAVLAPSSTALMASDPETAKALSEATRQAVDTIEQITNPSADRIQLRKRLDELTKKLLKPGVTLSNGQPAPNADAKADDIANSLAPGKTWADIYAEGPDDKLKELVEELEKVVQN